MKYYILGTKENNIFKNLAFEASISEYLEQLYTEKQDSVLALLLWSNDKTIVLGRNQNIYKECNIDFCRENSISIARRKTGGGAVFHDLGNLNFTFFSSKDVSDLNNNYSIIKNALKTFGINATQTGRNDLTIDNRKFSGSAFYNTRNISLHHGTILINSPSSIINKALTPSKLKLKSHSVSSVKSRIINLNELNRLITPENFKQAMISSFQSFYKAESIINDIELNDTNTTKNYVFFSSPAWIYNTKTKTDFHLSKHFEWGETDIDVVVRQGKIEYCKIYTDALLPNLPEIITKCIEQASLKKIDFHKQYQQQLQDFKNSETEKILKDVLILFEDILI